MNSQSFDFSELQTLAGNRYGETDVPCRICGPGRRSAVNRRRDVLRIWLEPDFASFHCARCGVKGWARQAGARTKIDPEKMERIRRETAERQAEHERRQLGKARYLWRRREDPDDTLVATYLRARGFGGGPLPATIGYLRPSKPEHHPAMIAAFGIPAEPEPGVLVIDDDAVHGVHLTLLADDGSGKADTSKQKLMIGPSSGWPIVLAPPNDGLGVAITEGIEDALTAHAATGLGAWAAGSWGRLPAIADKVPDYVEAVTIYADADDGGQQGAHALAAALAARGIETFVEGAMK